jgi:hypothetical protein
VKITVMGFDRNSNLTFVREASGFTDRDSIARIEIPGLANYVNNSCPRLVQISAFSPEHIARRRFPDRDLRCQTVERSNRTVYLNDPNQVELQPDFTVPPVRLFCIPIEENREEN